MFEGLRTQGSVARRGFEVVLAVVLVSILGPETAEAKGWRFATATGSDHLRYNRTEGLFAGIEATLTKSGRDWWELEGDGGYGVAGGDTRYGLTLHRIYGPGEKIRLSLGGFKRTETNEIPLIGWSENSAAALLFNRDFHDYFRASGFEARGRFTVRRYGIASISYRRSEYETMRVKEEGSLSDLLPDLLYKNTQFRRNPPVAVGTEQKIAARMVWDTRLNKFFAINDWVVDILVERAGGELGGDFEYTGLQVSVKRYRRIFSHQSLVLRGFYGVRDKVKEGQEQFLFDLGGIGTLRGFGYKEFTGNRAAMLNADFFLRGAVLRSLPLRFIPLYGSATLVAFADAGWANRDEKTDEGAGPARSFDTRDIKTDVGIGVSLGREFLRVDIARRLGHIGSGKDAYAATFRVMHTF